jgi:class 3 adenylate cyclase
MVRVARIIVENKFFVFVTTALTIFALTGDDCRLLWTNKPADSVFDYLIGICLAVFTIEIFISIVGKDDYFPGFFFILDVISTATLILDFSEVREAMAGASSDDDSASSLRSSKTARIGAKAGRIVRVIRLVRIIKLYKAVHDAGQLKRKAQEAHEDDEDDWDEEDIQAVENSGAQKHAESRVGRKLSDITTRRVICLVLTMLLVFPLLKADGESQFASSGWYGADNVWKKFQFYLQEQEAALGGSAANSYVFQDYEHALLTYVFFHNWYADRGYCTADKSLHCANQYFSHLFWVGIMGEKSNEAEIIDHADKAQITYQSVAQFLDKRRGFNDHMYVYGDAPTEAMELLSSPWSRRCETASGKYVRHGFSLLSRKIDGVVGYTVNCPEDLRIGETTKFYTRMITREKWSKWYMVFYFDLRPFIRTDAGYNLLVTGFLCVVLCTAALMFTHDANKLVLNPVEAMIKRVEHIRRDPLIALQMADEEFKAELIKQRMAKRSNRRDLKAFKKCFGESSSEPMETVILEKTIIKLGSLLALGFGEAGALIVAHNMRGGESASVDAMIPGRSVYCILGVARIKNFSTANEVLKGSIMTFANQIAEIVHGVVNEYHGAANKNNGDSFLLIWRMSEDEHIYDVAGKLLESRRFLFTRMAELSLVSFARVIGSLHHSPLLAEYRRHPLLQQKLGKSARVNMSFGLHFGWAIEGAVGSEFKIDASYLSPTVSIALGIEKATTQYGVPFILAESVYELLGDKMRDKLRLIDRVILTGSTKPIRLYSVDLDVNMVSVGPPPMQLQWNPRQRFKARQYLEAEKNEKLKIDLDIASLFESDRNIVAMRKPYTVDFMTMFNMGYQNYSQGEWPVARRLLMTTKDSLGDEDGPSRALLWFMEEYGFQAPREWSPPGFRDLSGMMGSGSMQRMSTLTSTQHKPNFTTI